jgi:hypothetical protein
MSDDNNTPPAAPAVPPVPAAAEQPLQPSQYSDYLIGTRDIILQGGSIWGDPDKPLAKNKLAEIEGRLAFMRTIGEAPPEPAPKWSHENLACERLAIEFPGGDPSTTLDPALANYYGQQVDALAKLDPERQADMAAKVAADVGRDQRRSRCPIPPGLTGARTHSCVAPRLSTPWPGKPRLR